MPLDDTTNTTLKTWHDASLHGEASSEWEALLDREIAVFRGKGGMLKKWPTWMTTWRGLIAGEGPKAGFSKHRASVKKATRGIVLAAFTGNARRIDAITHMHAIGLDFDSGTKRADVEARIKEMGVAAIVYTSHSDQKTVSELRHANLERAFPDYSGDWDELAVKAYLSQRASSYYTPEHIASIELTNPEFTTDDGLVVQYEHEALDKFRVILPLAESVPVKALGKTPEQRKAAWANKVVGAAWEMLDGHTDLACTDLTRVFYMPEHAPDAAGEISIFRGPPLTFEEIPTFAKQDYRAQFIPSASRRSTGDPTFPSGASAKRWAMEHDRAGRLNLATLIRSVAHDRIKEDKGYLLVVECPFEDEHRTAGGTATHVRDGDGDGFGFGCKRGDCEGRDRLDFLTEAVRVWPELTEDMLFDSVADWFAPASDDVLEEIEDDALDGLDNLKRAEDAPDAVDQTRNGTTDRTTPALAGSSTDKPRRRITDPLFDEAKLLNPNTGFVKGKKKEKVQENVTAIRIQMADAMREMCNWVVMDGGDARIFMRPVQGEAPVSFTKAGFMDMFANRTVPFSLTGEKVQFITPAVVFKTDSTRKTYIGTQFEPDEKKGHPDRFNLWNGFAVQPVAGDWSLLQYHVRDQIIAGNESADVSADYLFYWTMMRYAHMFQFPGEKMPNSIAFRGGEGVGKSKFCFWMRTAVGAASVKISQRNQLVGNFNASLDGRIYVVSEEAFFSGDKQAASALKDLVSDDTIQITKKYHESVDRSNYIRLDSVTNESWSVPAGENGDARRWLVVDVNDNRKQDRAFFAAIDKQMREGGVEAMVHYFMHFDPAEYGLDWSDLNAAPWTKARAEQAQEGLSGEIAKLKAIIDTGVIAGRTADGVTFYYDLSDTADTVVARPHLNAALTSGGKAYGGTGAKIQKALDDMVGIKATKDSRVVVEFAESGRDDCDPLKTEAKAVTFPPLGPLREQLAKRYG